MSDIPKLDTRGSQPAAKTLRYVAAAIILRGEGPSEEVLICQRRPDQPMGLKWEFPGGKIELGETAEEALARELQEELGIHVTVGQRITQLRHRYRNGGAVDLQFFVIRGFAGEIGQHIFNDIRWIPLRDLPTYDFLAADLNLIQDLAAGKLL